MLLTNGPEGATHIVLLAHGAGAPMDSPFMAQMAEGLAARGLRAVRFEFPYMARAREGHKRGAPDRMPVLERHFREVAEQLGDPRKLVIGGKSMGGRVATRIADALQPAGVVALGYPFHPPKKPESLRVEHLTALRTRCLIVQGTRDALGNQTEVQAYPLSPRIEIVWLEDGDHSFEPRKASGFSHAQHMQRAIDAVARFVEQL